MAGLTTVLIVFLSVLFLTEANTKWKCELIICPVCDFRATDTYQDFALRHLNSSGPSDGACISGEKYVHFGVDFGLANNACCCLPLTKITEVECSPRGSNVPDCAENLGIGRNELVSDYYKRITRLQKDAPENGCCRDGTFKYIYQKTYTGLTNDICACVIVNGGMAPDCSGSSSSSSEKYLSH